MKIGNWLSVGIGGFMGATTRYGFQHLPIAIYGVPINILVMNLIGAFVLGFFLELTMERLVLKPEIRLGIGTGFLGAFTTFSTLSLESVGFLKGQHPLWGLLYIATSLAGGIFSVWAGTNFARQIGYKAGAAHE